MSARDTTPDGWTPVPRDFYRRHPCDVAPQLLGKLLLRDDGRAGRIVEVEAYAGSEDPAAHSYRGQTPRNATMFGPPGHLYVYLSYGIHWCANAVCSEVGEGHGVLIRALEPVAGLERMRMARGPRIRDRDLARGPGCVGQAMGLDRSDDGADLVEGDRGIRIVSDDAPQPAFVAGPRIGIRQAADNPWRFLVADSPHVSGPRYRPVN